VSIGEYAFTGNMLTIVNVPESVTTISSDAFANNNLSEIAIPDSVKNIDIHAFVDNPLIKIEIGEKVTINSYSFCNGFEKAYIDKEGAKGTYTRSNADSNTWSYTP